MNKEGRAYNSAFSITSSDINSSRCQRPTEDRFWKSLPVTHLVPKQTKVGKNLSSTDYQYPLTDVPFRLPIKVFLTNVAPSNILILCCRTRNLIKLDIVIIYYVRSAFFRA